MLPRENDAADVALDAVEIGEGQTEEKSEDEVDDERGDIYDGQLTRKETLVDQSKSPTSSNTDERGVASSKGVAEDSMESNNNHMGENGIPRSAHPWKCLSVAQTLRGIVRRLGRLTSWFCGVEARDDAENSEAASRHRDRLQRISSLKQHPIIKLFLDINAVVVVLLGVFIYIYFSVPQASQ